jgi:hypothetical protein
MSRALTASRRWSNPVGWVCLAVNLLWMLNLLTASYVVYGLRAAALLFGAYSILLLPEGRLPSSRWRPVSRVVPVGLHDRRYREPRG